MCTTRLTSKGFCKGIPARQCASLKPSLGGGIYQANRASLIFIETQ